MGEKSGTFWLGGYPQKQFQRLEFDWMITGSDSDYAGNAAGTLEGSLQGSEPSCTPPPLEYKYFQLG